MAKSKKIDVNERIVEITLNLFDFLMKTYGEEDPKRPKKSYSISPHIADRILVQDLITSNGYFQYLITSLKKFYKNFIFIDNSTSLSDLFEYLRTLPRVTPHDSTSKWNLSTLIRHPTHVQRKPIYFKEKMHVFCHSDQKSTFHRKECVSCGRVFSALYGQQKYCYPGCKKEKENTNVRICPICGETYTGRTDKQTCSKSWCQKAYWRKNRGKKLQPVSDNQ